MLDYHVLLFVCGWFRVHEFLEFLDIKRSLTGWMSGM